MAAARTGLRLRYDTAGARRPGPHRSGRAARRGAGPGAHRPGVRLRRACPRAAAALPARHHPHGYDAKLAAAQYLRWLGFEGIRVAERTPASGVDVRGPSVVAHVDPSTSPAGVRDVETLWLNGLNDSVAAVCFALAGYLREARARADELRVPLFVLDLTGTPRAVNDAAEHLIRTPR